MLQLLAFCTIRSVPQCTRENKRCEEYLIVSYSASVTFIKLDARSLSTSLSSPTRAHAGDAQQSK